MHSVTFMTESALDHVIRALDELARAGFTLDALRVSDTAPIQQVRIDFISAGTVSAGTYAARLCRMSGLWDLRLDDSDAPTRPTPHLTCQLTA